MRLIEKLMLPSLLLLLLLLAAGPSAVGRGLASPGGLAFPGGLASPGLAVAVSRASSSVSRRTAPTVSPENALPQTRDPDDNELESGVSLACR